MKISTFLHEHYLICELQEEKLSSTIAPALKSQFVTWNAEGKNNVIMDLTQVKYTDSSGLSALLNARRLYNGAGGIFVLFGLTPNVESLIKITQLEKVLNIVKTKQEAIEMVFMQVLDAEEKPESGEDEEEAAT